MTQSGSKLVLIIALVAVSAGSLVAGFFFGRSKAPAAAVNPATGSAQTPSAAPDGPGSVTLTKEALEKNKLEIVPVRMVRLARDLEVVGSVGMAEDHHAQVGPLIAGRIVAVKVRVGDLVTAGQVLAELESAEVGQAQATYLAARATAQAAQMNLKRERELAEQKVSSMRERELAEAAAITEQAQLAAATQRLRALGMSQADISKIHPDRAGIVPLGSPISGTIIARSVTLGQAVQSASDAFEVADLSKLWVLLDLFEKDLPYVQTDERAEIRIEAYPGRTFPARVALIGSVIDPKTRTAPVRIEFDNEAGLFRPGQFVTATLRGDQSRAPHEVLAVPRKALLTAEGKQLVFAQEPNGTFSRRVVEIGASGGGMVEIRKGISEGQNVVVDGAFLLKSELLR